MASPKAVWKFPLELETQFKLEMPRGSRPLAVQAQRGQACLWALCPVKEPKETYHFVVVGTGHEYPSKFWQGLEYVGTFQLYDGALVFHLFMEQGKAGET